MNEFCVILLGFSMLYGMVALLSTLFFFKKKSGYPRNHDGVWLPVSILKPTCGNRPNLDKALESSCFQEYPQYQVIIGVENENDPALNVILSLCEKYPQHVEVVIGEKSPPVEGSNGKIKLLCKMYPKARYDILIISDSDMLFTPDYARNIASSFQNPKVGVVTCLYCSVEGHGLAGALEAFAININFLPSVMVARLLGEISFAFGATMAVRREALEKIQGLESLKDYLADDYLLGNRIYKAGYKIFLSNYLVKSLNHIQSLSEYFSHQVRWARTYRICQPWGYFFSFITHTFTLSLLLLFLQPHFFIGLLGVGCALLMRLIVVISLTIRGIHGREYLKYLWALPMFDICQSIIWALAFLGNTVRWNDKIFRIQKNGMMIPILEKR